MQNFSHVPYGLTSGPFGLFLGPADLGKTPGFWVSYAVSQMFICTYLLLQNFGHILDGLT